MVGTFSYVTAALAGAVCGAISGGMLAIACGFAGAWVGETAGQAVADVAVKPVSDLVGGIEDVGSSAINTAKDLGGLF